MSEDPHGGSRGLVVGLTAGVVALGLLNVALLVALLSDDPPSATPCDCAAEIAAAAAAGGLDPAALSAYTGDAEPPQGDDGADPPDSPEDHARAFLAERVAAIEAAGAEQGVDVTPYVPSQAAVDAAVASGGPETPQSQRVIDQLRAGHERLGLEFEIPAGPDGAASP